MGLLLYCTFPSTPYLYPRSITNHALNLPPSCPCCLKNSRRHACPRYLLESCLPSRDSSFFDYLSNQPKQHKRQQRKPTMAISPQLREEVTARFDQLIEALETHPQWRGPPNPNPSLYFVWDFANRSKYMISEYDNIASGRPVQYPNQFRPAPGMSTSLAPE
ncbi:hypothetical protein ACMFMG_010706 [Clarireedia jacksonii]